MLTPAIRGRVSLLGSFRLSWRTGPVALPEGGQRVVAYLALADEGATRRSLTAALWPDLRSDRALATLRSTLWRIHRIMPNLIRRDGSRLALDPSFEVDARELDRAVHVALEAPSESGPDDLAALTHADDLLADWDDEWVVVERERMHQLRLEALEHLAEDLTDRGLLGQAVEAGLAAVADEPYRESAHRVLIEAYARKGNLAAAVAQFQRLRSVLRTELGVAPSPDLAARIRRLRSGRRDAGR